MPTPADLRAESRLYQNAARKEPEPYLKRLLANHAFALAQLAEKLERETGEKPANPKIGFY